MRTARWRALGVFRDPAAHVPGARDHRRRRTSCASCRTSAASTSPRTSTARYQISTGQLRAREDRAAPSFSGACLPLDVILRSAHGAERRVLPAQPRARRACARSGELDISAAEHPACPDDRRSGFVTFSTFGSPVPYLAAGRRRSSSPASSAPASTGCCIVGAVRGARGVRGAGRGSRSGASPRSKWALCRGGLAAGRGVPDRRRRCRTTRSPPRSSLLVVSSALRALDPPARHVEPRALAHRGAGAQRAARLVQAGVRGDRRSATCCRCSGARSVAPRPVAAGVRAGARRGRVGGVEPGRRQPLEDRRRVLRHQGRRRPSRSTCSPRARGTSAPTACARWCDQLWDWMQARSSTVGPERHPDWPIVRR